MRCESCGWRGGIETEVVAKDEWVENTTIEHCPVCGGWGLIK